MSNGGRALVVALLASSAGCGHLPTPASPELDLAAKQFGPPAPGQATLYVYRKQWIAGRIVLPILLDGVPVTSTSAKRFVWLTIPPGSHRIVSRGSNEAVLDIVVDPGGSYFVSQELTPGIVLPGTSLRLVDEKSGRAGVMKCYLIDTSKPPGDGNPHVLVP